MTGILEALSQSCTMLCCVMPVGLYVIALAARKFRS